MLKLYVAIDFYAQVSTVCELEACIDAGGVIFEIDCRDVDREIFEVELGANLGVLVNDVAFFKDDIAQAEFDREAGCDFGGAFAFAILHFLFFGVFGVVDAVFLGEKIQNVAEVESCAVLRGAHIERFHVDIANVQRSRDKLQRIDVHAELVECDKFCLVVGFHDCQSIDIQNIGERVQADVLDSDASTNHLFGMFFDVAAGNLGCHEERYEVEYDE